jgi:hypothetical protein
MKCLWTLLRGMSHFNSPRKSIRAGLGRSGHRLNVNQISAGSTQSVDILFDGVIATAEEG